jgi:hypothetical protein
LSLMTSSPPRHPARTVNLVVTCSQRKRRLVPARLQLRSVRAHSASVAANRWVERLAHADVDAIAGENLYAGEHWSVVAALPAMAAARGIRLSVWVCSAGYGLVPAAALLKPYSATFAAGHPDSVPGTGLDWWGRLAAWEGPTPGEPRTIADLARRYPRALLLLALSAPYLSSCRADAVEAAHHLRGHRQLAIISAGTRPSGTLYPHFLPANARLQAVLGGTRQALNARIAGFLLSHIAPDLLLSRSRDALADLLAAQPPPPAYDRRRLSDDEVRLFIRRRLEIDNGLAKSRLLSELRHSGLACEQARFGQLYALEYVQ